MPVLPNMNLITPTLGGDSGSWDDKINAMMALIDAHDHTSGKGVAVPVSGMSFNADINLTTFGATLSKVTFNTIAAPVSGSKNLFVNSADNELYWRSNAGTNVKLTSGATINTSLVGGIVGDYSSVSALFAFSDADKVYTAKTQTSTWARLATGPVRIYEYNTTESVYVEHAVAAALASSYTVTWPAAVPAADAYLQISAAGVLAFSEPVAKVLNIPGADAVIANGAPHTFANGLWTLGSSILALFFAVPIVVGKTISSFTLNATKNSDATNTLTAQLYYNSASSGLNAVGAAATSAANAPGAITLTTGSLARVVAANEFFVLSVSQSDSTPSAADTIHNLIVNYT